MIDVLEAVHALIAADEPAGVRIYGLAVAAASHPPPSAS